MNTNTDAEREPLPAPPVPPLPQEVWVRQHGGRPVRVGPRLVGLPDGATIVEDGTGRSWRVDPPSDPSDEAASVRRYWDACLKLGVFAQSLYHAAERGWMTMPPKWDVLFDLDPDVPLPPPADPAAALARIEAFVARCRREVEAWSAGRDVVRRRML